MIKRVSDDSHVSGGGESRLAITPLNWRNGIMRQASDKRIYSVEELILGDKVKGDKITFHTMGDLESAYRDLNDGKDIYVEKDGIITLLPQRMIAGRIYDGTLVLTALRGGSGGGD